MRYDCFVAGEKIASEAELKVHNPYNGEIAGIVGAATAADTDRALERTRRPDTPTTRYERYAVLDTARRRLLERTNEFARLITSESGLCIRETRYEVGRALDVLQCAAMEAMRDDGQAFSGDVSPQGKARRIFTMREPHDLVVAITPFNHPLNQVAHKLAPAIAAGVPVILKPSEKTPLTALRFAELLYDSGLPPEMLSVLVGPTAQVAERLVRDPRVEVVSFTGSVAVGKRIAQTAGYKKVLLELGGNDPLIVLEDADLELAAHLAAEGCFRNSGQRCTAVKRLLIQHSILEAFTEKFLARARGYRCGDPLDPETMVGTVIDEPAAAHLEGLVRRAIDAGAKLLLGGAREGAQLAPTILADVPRDAEMVTCEAFGPLAPIVAVRDLDDAIALANGTPYGLSSGIVTRSLESALRAVRSLRCGTVNVNEVPGYRTEASPFGGIKDSGLGVKEGVVEAIRWMTYVKTFSLPW